MLYIALLEQKLSLQVNSICIVLLMHWKLAIWTQNQNIPLTTPTVGIMKAIQ